MQAFWSSWTFVTVKLGKESVFSEYNIIILVFTTGCLKLCRLAMLLERLGSPQEEKCSNSKGALVITCYQKYSFFLLLTHIPLSFFFFFCTLIRHVFILFDLSYTNVFASSIDRYLNMENYQFARVYKDRKENCRHCLYH